MQLAMSTLGTPTWDIETLCTRAAAYGYDGVDVRGYLDELDITRHPAFTDDLTKTAAQFHEAGLAISALSSSIGLCEPDRREAALGEARRFMTIVEIFDIEYIRVFGRGDLDTYDREQLAAFAAETIDELNQIEGATARTWMIETHDHWLEHAHISQLLDAIDASNVHVLWDIGNTLRFTDDTPEDTVTALGSEICYVHLKDASYDPTHPGAMDDGWRYVVPGAGDLPLESAIELLIADGYDGWYAFEHEKRWHPELPDAEEIYPACVEWIQGIAQRRTS